MSASPLTLALGTWVATGQPDRDVEITVDPRLFTWFVNQAARRSNLSYTIKEGRPPATITLS